MVRLKGECSSTPRLSHQTQPRYPLMESRMWKAALCGLFRKQWCGCQSQ